MRKTSAFAGFEGTWTLELTDVERRTLRNAARILAENARILAEIRAHRTDDDDALTVDIALAHYVCAELAQEGEIEV